MEDRKRHNRKLKRLLFAGKISQEQAAPLFRKNEGGEMKEEEKNESAVRASPGIPASMVSPLLRPCPLSRAMLLPRKLEAVSSLVWSFIAVNSRCQTCDENAGLPVRHSNGFWSSICPKCWDVYVDSLPASEKPSHKIHLLQHSAGSFRAGATSNRRNPAFSERSESESSEAF